MRKKKIIIAKIGDKITYGIGKNKIDGVIIEDRGFIGVGGRQLVRISSFFNEEIKEFELSVEDFEFI